MSDSPANVPSAEAPGNRAASIMSSQPRKIWRLIRLGVAAMLLVLYAVSVLTFYKECSIVTSESSSTGTLLQTTCQSPTVTSANVLVLILLVVLLLWPDISEVTVLGVTLKRRVAEAEAEAQKAKEDVAALGISLQLQQTRIDTVSAAAAAAAASASANVTTTNNWDRGPEWTRGMAEQLEEIAKRIGGEPTTSTDSVDESPSAEHADSLKMQLLNQFEALANSLGLYRRHVGRDLDREEKRLAFAQREFLAMNKDAIQSVRALRNGIAHGQPVSGQEVREGMNVLASLTSDLESHFVDRDIISPPLSDE